ncbi:putative glycosyltransferase [Chlamydiales bacterium STE3]|nr:putative glycosyltransferase [Chlamydiales bacterium STE3]
MRIKQVIFYLILGLLTACQLEAKQLTINIFSSLNGKGLEADQKILASTLRELGHNVVCKKLSDTSNNPIPADINIFLEMVLTHWTPYAKYNWFIPNPEWFYQDVAVLDHIDLILCRTREIEKIFMTLNRMVYYMGFTSEDCFQPKIQKNFSLYLHVCGGSRQKGTSSIIELWLRNPSMPDLVLIKHHGLPILNQSNLHTISQRVDKGTLREFQNRCGIHLCPSETEGFGHTLMEAMSTGAVVVTTNAPPMNEFVVDERFLIPFERSAQQRLGTNYYINSRSLEQTLKRLSYLSEEELNAIGQNNRKTFLRKKKDFKKKLAALMQSVSVD